MFFFFNDTATTEIYTLSLHDALPIFYGYDFADDPRQAVEWVNLRTTGIGPIRRPDVVELEPGEGGADRSRSEEHTSELQSRQYLVCRLLLEKKKYLCLDIVNELAARN